MNILVTGGAGFIGRWLVKRLIGDGHRVWILDNLSNGSMENIKEFANNGNPAGFEKGDIKNTSALKTMFKNKPEICFHLAASINVQDSIGDPRTTFQNDVTGTFNVLEECRKLGTKMVFMSTCMVYDSTNNTNKIDERHPVKPASPYAGSKIAAENMVLSYYYSYKLPVVVVRPFNTYGPFQKSSGEGGVVSIFISQSLKGEPLNIYGSGEQTRDLLYVEDCADFLVRAGTNSNAVGEVLNAGTGRDITINNLASMICGQENKIRHIPHIHPQSEIMKLICNCDKVKRLVGWEHKTPLEDGIAKTGEWIKHYLEV